MKRYDIWPVESYGHPALEINEERDGEWVRYEPVKILTANEVPCSGPYLWRASAKHEWKFVRVIYAGETINLVRKLNDFSYDYLDGEFIGPIDLP